MARLSHEESLALVKAFIRGQSLLKGCAIDCARIALPETLDDRQFKALVATVKNKEGALRKTYVQSMVAAGIIEELTNEELFHQDMK